MPIKIRELHVKATISDGEAPKSKTSTGVDMVLDLQSIVALCTEQVLRRLKIKEER